MIPAPNFSNLFLQVGASTARGVFISTAVAAAQGERKLGLPAAWGGMGGFAGSQQVRNWNEGYGFRSHNEVIEVLASEGRFQEAIDFASRR